MPSFARFGMLATYRKTFFGSTAARPARISSGAPALPLEVDDVRLHEDGAAVAEDRHRLGGEGHIGELSTPTPNPSAVDCRK